MSENENKNKAPLTYRIGLWYGFALSIIFLIYGGVKIVLSFLDNNFAELSSLIFFAVLGLILLAVAIAYQQFKKIGWYGMISISSLVFVLTIYNFFQKGNGPNLFIENILIMLCTAAALYALFAGQTKKYLNQYN